jgi:hypothetical protein
MEVPKFYEEKPFYMTNQHLKYEDHISSLRELPCAPGSVWEEDRIYEENKDYSLNISESETIAFPISMIHSFPTEAAPIPRKMICGIFL